MQIGFVGLGQMGGNMVTRIRRDSDHEVVAFDFDAEAVARAKQTARRASPACAPSSRRSSRRARCGSWCRPATRRRRRSRRWRSCSSPTTRSSTAATRSGPTTRPAPQMLRKQKIHYIDVGTSGGVWGLEVGYCMMVGGRCARCRRLAPILDVLAPPTAPDSVAAIGPRGWHHFGPSGAGHYVKMVHNAIEYGLMQAYAEGFELFEQSEYELDNAKIAHLWNQGSVVRSWLCELAARAFEADGNDLAGLEGWVEDSGEGRWTLQDAIDHDVPTPALSAALNAASTRASRATTAPACSRRCATSSAATRCTRAERSDGDRRGPQPARARASSGCRSRPTNLVIFGATGDLARRKLLPAIYNLAHEGALPERFNLIGVSRGELTQRASSARSPPSRSARSRARRPTRPCSRACSTTCATSRARSTTRRSTRRIAPRARRARRGAGEPMARAFYLSTAPEFFPVIVGQLGAAGLDELGRGAGPSRDREAVRHLARRGARAQPHGARRLRRAPGLPHRPLPRQGDGPEHAGVPLRQRHVRAALEPQLHRPTCRSPPPRTSASAAAPATTTTPARCATSSRTTCCSC